MHFSKFMQKFHALLCIYRKRWCLIKEKRSTRNKFDVREAYVKK